MRKTIQIIDLPRPASSFLKDLTIRVAGTAGETAVFVMVIAGVFFTISFVIIYLLNHLSKNI